MTLIVTEDVIFRDLANLSCPAIPAVLDFPSNHERDTALAHYREKPREFPA